MPATAPARLAVPTPEEFLRDLRNAQGVLAAFLRAYEAVRRQRPDLPLPVGTHLSVAARAVGWAAADLAEALEVAGQRKETTP